MRHICEIFRLQSVHYKNANIVIRGESDKRRSTLCFVVSSLCSCSLFCVNCEGEMTVCKTFIHWGGGGGEEEVCEPYKQDYCWSE